MASLSVQTPVTLKLKYNKGTVTVQYTATCNEVKTDLYTRRTEDVSVLGQYLFKVKFQCGTDGHKPHTLVGKKQTCKRGISLFLLIFFFLFYFLLLPGFHLKLLQ